MENNKFGPLIPVPVCPKCNKKLQGRRLGKTLTIVLGNSPVCCGYKGFVKYKKEWNVWPDDISEKGHNGK